MSAPSTAAHHSALSRTELQVLHSRICRQLDREHLTKWLYKAWSAPVSYAADHVRGFVNTR